MRLLDYIFPPRADELALRDVSLDTFLAHSAPRLVEYTRPGTVALLPFSHIAVRAALHEAKYHGSGYAFELLGAVLADYLRDIDEMRNKSTQLCLVPVPLGKKRIKERGYNQSEEILRSAIGILTEEDGICTYSLHPRLLARTRDTVSQVSLPRDEREGNMCGAFHCPLQIDEGEGGEAASIYIVLDDVITTGATLQAAVSALKKAGAKRIIPLALAH